jgi:hypothetical protein
VPGTQAFNRLVRRRAFLTVALMAALIFGIVVLTGGDWLPGGIIVAAALVGLSVLVPEIWRLCSRGPAPSPPSTNRAGPHRHHRPPEPHA